MPQESPAPPHGAAEASPSEEELKQAAEDAEKARVLAEQQAEEERKKAEEQAEAERKAKDEEAAKKQEEDKEEEEARKRRNGMARFKYEMYDQVRLWQCVRSSSRGNMAESRLRPYDVDSWHGVLRWFDECLFA